MSNLAQDNAVIKKEMNGNLDASFIGAPFKVFLSGGYTVENDKISICDLPGLIAAVVKFRIFHPRVLLGKELKFIRAALAKKSSEIAEMIDITPEHYSRCENGSKTLSVAQEKLYRMAIYLYLISKDLGLRKLASEQADQYKNQLDFQKQTDKKTIKAFETLCSVFLGMKIIKIFDVEEVIEVVLCRRPTVVDKPTFEDDEDWVDQSELAA